MVKCAIQTNSVDECTKPSAAETESLLTFFHSLYTLFLATYTRYSYIQVCVLHFCIWYSDWNRHNVYTDEEKRDLLLHVNREFSAKKVFILFCLCRLEVCFVQSG